MELHDYQKKLVNFIWSHRNCVVSVDMGLGKTIAVLTCLDFFWRRNKGRVPGVLKGAIVAPKRVAENNWKQEAEKWGLADLANNMVVVAGSKKKRGEALKSSCPIKVIGRENVAELKSLGDLDFLVLDELTSFKNMKAKRTKDVLDLKADRRIGLTGTFLANGAIDIYAQCQAVGLAGEGMGFWAWRATYFRDVMAKAKCSWQNWQLRVPLERVLAPYQRDIFTLTAGDYLEIPPVTERTILVELSEEEKTAYDSLQAILCCQIGDDVISFDEAQKFAKLQTLCDGFVYKEVENEEKMEIVRCEKSSKISEVVDFVERCVNENEKVLLFYSFVEEKNWLVEELTKKKIKVADVKEKDFLKKWDNDECDVLIAHPASAGHGLNLQNGGRIIVWSSITFNFEFFAQSNARLARQGQKKPVSIYYFLAKETVEMQMLAALKKKKEEQAKFLNLTK